MSGNNNPLAGRVPLHMRKAGQEETIAKSTSYRSGTTHPVTYRTPQNERLKRNEGCTPLRRYPNGQLDVEYVAHQIIDLIHKIEDQGKLTTFEEALLAVILPGKYDWIDPKIANTMARMSNQEKLLVAARVHMHLNAEMNWNAGRGGGSVPGRQNSRS